MRGFYCMCPPLAPVAPLPSRRFCRANHYINQTRSVRALCGSDGHHDGYYIPLSGVNRDKIGGRCLFQGYILPALPLYLLLCGSKTPTQPAIVGRVTGSDPPPVAVFFSAVPGVVVGRRFCWEFLLLPVAEAPPAEGGGILAERALLGGLQDQA